MKYPKIVTVLLISTFCRLYLRRHSKQGKLISAVRDVSLLLFNDYIYCANIFGKKRDSSVTVPFIVVRYGLLYYKSKKLASRYIKVTKIKVHHWIATSFNHLRMSIDTRQDTANEIISKLGFVGIELTFFTISSFNH